MEGVWVHDDAYAYVTNNPSYGATSTPAKVKDPIESASDDVLILELVKRGYAVGKLNEDNKLDG